METDPTPQDTLLAPAVDTFTHPQALVAPILGDAVEAAVEVAAEVAVIETDRT